MGPVNTTPLQILILKSDRLYAEFLRQIEDLVKVEAGIRARGLPKDAKDLLDLKKKGFSDERLAELEKARAWSPRLISKIESHIRSGDDEALFRINPYTFAKQRGLNEAEVIDLRTLAPLDDEAIFATVRPNDAPSAVVPPPIMTKYCGTALP